MNLRPLPPQTNLKTRPLPSRNQGRRTTQKPLKNQGLFAILVYHRIKPERRPDGVAGQKAQQNAHAPRRARRDRWGGYGSVRRNLLSPRHTQWGTRLRGEPARGHIRHGFHAQCNARKLPLVLQPFKYGSKKHGNGTEGAKCRTSLAACGSAVCQQSVNTYPFTFTGSP